MQNVSLKVKVGDDHEIAQSDRNSYTENRGGKNQFNNQVLILKSIS